MKNEIEEALLIARARWPDVDVSGEVFSRYVQERLPAGVRGAHLSDLYLACACAHGDLGAIARFQEHFLSGLPRTLSHLQPTADFLKDVRQSLMEHWFVPDRDKPVRISEYSGRGPLRHWVRAVALCIALNLKRKGRLEVAAGDTHLFEAADLVEDSELAFLRLHYRDELETALTLALAVLSSRERNILRLHYLSGLTYEQLSSVYRVHRATVARWLASSRQAILSQLSQLLTSRLGINKSELESLLRVIRGRLDISLIRLLAEPRTPSGSRPAGS